MGSMEEQRFIVDTMLGDLAKWLRIMGYDVIYYKDYEDHQIIEAASLGGRIILTRDRGLFRKARKASVRAVLIESIDIAERIAEVAKKTGIEIRADPRKSRCPECNGILDKVTDKQKVRERVPPVALSTYSEFYVCAKCGNVYWEGSHWENIRRRIEEARQALRLLTRGRRKSSHDLSNTQ